MMRFNVFLFAFYVVIANPLKVTGQCKTLIVIGDDRSGSANVIRRLTEDEYSKIMNIINDKGCGVMSIVLIGNPKPGAQKLFCLHGSM